MKSDEKQPPKTAILWLILNPIMKSMLQMKKIMSGRSLEDLVFELKQMDQSTMYDRIRRLRLDQEMSQDELARLVGYKGRHMIARIEAGQVDISQSKIKAFAKALNTSSESLMNGETPMYDFQYRLQRLLS